MMNKFSFARWKVKSCWVFLATLEEEITYEQVGINTTYDDELRTALHDAVKMCESQVKRLTEFLVNEGVPLPPAPEKMPKCDSTDIPTGVKLTDNQLANGLSAKIAGAIIECAGEVSNAIRNDVGSIFAQFLGEHMTFGATLKTMMKKRGWLKVPPY